MTDEAKVWERIVVGDCWEWAGPVTTAGSRGHRLSGKNLVHLKSRGTFQCRECYNRMCRESKARARMRA